MANPERLRPGIDEFVDKTFLTDACLLYSPSQIALAAVLHAASKEQENLDSYVTESLFHSAQNKLPVLVEAVRSKFVRFSFRYSMVSSSFEIGTNPELLLNFVLTGRVRPRIILNQKHNPDQFTILIFLETLFVEITTKSKPRIAKSYIFLNI